MASKAPPTIFAPNRRRALRRRMIALQQQPGAPRYLIDDMVEDVLERLAFVRLEPKHALVVGDYSGALANELRARGAEVTEADPGTGLDEEAPYPFEGFDLIATLGTLDTVNDLPGALFHTRRALAQNGMLIASFLSAGSLPATRDIMLSADADRPAGRIHPAVDVRAGAQLLQRALFADPVSDQRALKVRFSGFQRLVGDLRAQGLTSVLAQAGPVLGKAAFARVEAAFVAASQDGRVTETFEILTLSGWKR